MSVVIRDLENLSQLFPQLTDEMLIRRPGVHKDYTITLADLQTLIGGGGGGGGADPFTADFIPTVQFGQYAPGATVPANGKTARQVILDAYIPYINPAFTSFAITGQAIQIEVGTTITSGSKTFTWGTSTPGNINTNSIVVRNITASTILASALANTGSSNISVPAPIQLNANNATQVFQIQATNTHSTQFTQNLTITANLLRFYGTPGSAPINSANVRALGNQTFNSTFSINITAGQTVISFAYDASRADISNGSVIYTQGLGASVGNTFTKSTFNVNDAGGTARSYKVYTAVLGAPYPSTATYVVTIP